MTRWVAAAMRSASDQMTEMINPDQDEPMDIAAAQLVAYLKQSEDIINAQQLEDRARLTMNALNSLALYLSGLPGRKNLIWFSGSFPIDILPDPDQGFSSFGNTLDMQEEFQRITSMLARSQVAVYPVDARGLTISPINQAASANPSYVGINTRIVQDNKNFALDTISANTPLCVRWLTRPAASPSSTPMTSAVPSPKLSATAPATTRSPIRPPTTSGMIDYTQDRGPPAAARIQPQLSPRLLRRRSRPRPQHRRHLR